MWLHCWVIIPLIKRSTLKPQQLNCLQNKPSTLDATRHCMSAFGPWMLLLSLVQAPIHNLGDFLMSKARHLYAVHHCRIASTHNASRLVDGQLRNPDTSSAPCQVCGANSNVKNALIKSWDRQPICVDKIGFKHVLQQRPDKIPISHRNSSVQILNTKANAVIES